MKTKIFTFGMEWKMYGNQSVEVPADYTQEQAEGYVKEHWDEIALPSDGEYLTDSDVPDFEDSSFEEDV